MIFRTLILALNPLNGFCVNTINLGPWSTLVNQIRLWWWHTHLSRGNGWLFVALWVLTLKRFEVWNRRIDRWTDGRQNLHPGWKCLVCRKAFNLPLDIMWWIVRRGLLRVTNHIHLGSWHLINKLLTCCHNLEPRGLILFPHTASDDPPQTKRLASRWSANHLCQKHGHGHAASVNKQ